VLKVIRTLHITSDQLISDANNRNFILTAVAAAVAGMVTVALEDAEKNAQQCSRSSQKAGSGQVAASNVVYLAEPTAAQGVGRTQPISSAVRMDLAGRRQTDDH